MSKKPTVLMILDGYGLNDNCEHNAVCEGKTPVMDQLMSQCPFVRERPAAWRWDFRKDRWATLR
ncbi:MAG: hypothetical protein ACLR0U_08820 [Enterocloster clostridioformis]